jgi:aldehyde dehydrogenase (NAD+)
MGGKNPTVVCADADLDDAVNIVASGAFSVTGQVCTACSLAIVHEEVYHEFVSKLVKHAASIDDGPGLGNFGMGLQSSEEELRETLEYIQTKVEEGATLETGGGRPDGDSLYDGYFVEPTVFSDVTPEMTIAQEEIFGPVVSVIPVSGYDKAVTVTNGVEQGLSASVVTNDLTKAHRFVDEIDAGVVKTNEKTTGLELHVPFGGIKTSSSETFRNQGDEGLAFYTISKTVYLN